MAYQQFTKCVQPEDFTDLSPENLAGKAIIGLGIVSVLAIIGLAIAAAVSPLTSKPAIAAALFLVLSIIGYLTWWLNGRLICLNESDRNCAIIGRINGHGLSDSFKGGDDDYTMNLDLALGQEYLFSENSKITAIGRGYTTKEKYITMLHCEFEGNGIYKIREYLINIAGWLTLALLIPWPVDLMLAILAFLIAILGGLDSFRSPSAAADPGNPLDVNPNLGPLNNGDLVVVKGEWIYDSLHAGWNEIHPVRHCEILIRRESIAVSDEDLSWDDYIVFNPETSQPMALNTPENVELYRQFLCGAIRDAENAEEGGSREDPKNDWVIHPLIDGCKPEEVID